MNVLADEIVFGRALVSAFVVEMDKRRDAHLHMKLLEALKSLALAPAFYNVHNQVRDLLGKVGDTKGSKSRMEELQEVGMGSAVTWSECQPPTSTRYAR